MTHPILRLLRDYAWPYRIQYVCGIVCLGLTNLLMVSIPLQIGQAIDRMNEGLDPSTAIWLIMGMGLAVILVRNLCLHTALLIRP